MRAMDDSLASRVPRSLPILNVLDNVHACSYLPGRMATLPLIFPARTISGPEFDHMLAHGMRRSGFFAYYTACGTCSACEPTRLDVHKFRWTDSWRRIVNRGDRLLQMEYGPPKLDDERLRLFNLHRSTRGLGQGDDAYRESDYEGFLVDSCCESTLELRFHYQGSLIALSLVDLGEASLSAVYTYFDPEHSKWSLGSYAVLKLIQLAQHTERRYVYLGLFVADNRHLSYKARFLPNERFIDGQWVEFTS
jgi:leucyl-tRNA---protein transferase